jgi:sarcosine oxidase subunit delta
MPARRISRGRPTSPRSRRGFRKVLLHPRQPKGVVFERWRHIHGCGRFFNAVRDSVSDKFVMTYKAGEKKPSIKAGAKK